MPATGGGQIVWRQSTPWVLRRHTTDHAPARASARASSPQGGGVAAIGTLGYFAATPPRTLQRCLGQWGRSQAGGVAAIKPQVRFAAAPPSSPSRAARGQVVWRQVATQGGSPPHHPRAVLWQAADRRVQWP
jgi:hypothetical protein